tara:strand:+ start:2482 stop:2655 length:174 start_codon:yes stop_codon:yes gene_type:complete
MRCEQCDSCITWQGDKDGIEMPFNQEKWLFVRVFLCEKCGCATHVYYPKEQTDESMQ